MQLLQCSIRDLLWLTTVVALAVIWQRDRVTWSMQQQAWNAERQSLIEIRTKRGLRIVGGRAAADPRPAGRRAK
jgi:hypothetical protein